jgi:hypothetical protein
MSVWQLGYVSADSVTSTIFGKLVELAIKDGIEAYHSDLYHDATRLQESLTGEHLSALDAKGRICFLWAARDNGCGTDMCCIEGPQHQREYWGAARNTQKGHHYAIVVTRHISEHIGVTNDYNVQVSRIDCRSTTSAR